MLSEFPRPTIFMDNLLPLNAIGTILGVIPGSRDREGAWRPGIRQHSLPFAWSEVPLRGYRPTGQRAHTRRGVTRRVSNITSLLPGPYDCRHSPSVSRALDCI
jgi:hypothetical protein